MFFIENGLWYYVFDYLSMDCLSYLRPPKWAIKDGVALQCQVTPRLALKGMYNDIRRNISIRRKNLHLSLHESTNDPEIVKMEYKLWDIATCLLPLK